MQYKNEKTENKHTKSFFEEVIVTSLLVAVFSVSFANASGITSDMVIKLVNEARKDANIKALKKNDLLQKAAQDKADDMLDNNYFAHVSPVGTSPWDWIQATGYNYHYAGENLAINYINAEDQQRAWMESPLHQKNILNPEYEETGVAVAQGVIDGHKTTIAVQMFGAQFAPVANITPAKTVATANVAGANLTQNNSNQKLSSISNKVDLKVLYQNNKPTFIGWFIAVGIAFVIVAVDVLAISHKRYGHLLMMHGARRRHI